MKWNTNTESVVEQTVEMSGEFEGEMKPAPQVSIHLYKRRDYITLSVRQGNIAGSVPLTLEIAAELADHLLRLSGRTAAEGRE
jgi:hypothetical protein